MSHRKYIRVRKTTKINFVSKVTKIDFNRLRERDLNVLGSYWGIFVHADCRHLWYKYTGFHNHDEFKKYIKELKKNKLNIKIMKWYIGNSQSLEQIKTIKKGVSEIKLSVKPIADDMKTAFDAEEFDVMYLRGEIKGNVSTAALKSLLLDLQREYDKSLYVNSFILRGQRKWLSKQERVGLVHSLNVEKAAGRTSSTLWLSGKPYTVDIDYMLSFLDNLELYAIECFNSTQIHLKEINSLKTREQILAYNITTNYPQFIEFDSTKLVNKN